MYLIVTPCLPCFILPETEEGNALHAVLGLFVLWSLYAAVLIYSPIFQTWDGFTHHSIGNTTIYTSNREL
jgi:hypothetical protein